MRIMVGVMTLNVQPQDMYVFTMAGGPVTWSSKQQATVALSTVEAEYVAMSRCAQQMVWTPLLPKVEGLVR